jgi:hypothetical protein
MDTTTIIVVTAILAIIKFWIIPLWEHFTNKDK